MRDYLFYNANSPERGFRRLAVPLRRFLRRLLLPFFQRLVSLLQELEREVEHLADRQGKLDAGFQERDLQAKRLQQAFENLAKRQTNLEAFHLDYDAMVRRLAAL